MIPTTEVVEVIPTTTLRKNFLCVASLISTFSFFIFYLGSWLEFVSASWWERSVWNWGINHCHILVWHNCFSFTGTFISCSSIIEYTHPRSTVVDGISNHLQGWAGLLRKICSNTNWVKVEFRDADKQQCFYTVTEYVVLCMHQSSDWLNYIYIWKKVEIIIMHNTS